MPTQTPEAQFLNALQEVRELASSMDSIAGAQQSALIAQEEHEASVNRSLRILYDKMGALEKQLASLAERLDTAEKAAPEENPNG